MLGSLIMFASGFFTNSPSSDKASVTFCSPVNFSGNKASILLAKEMSFVSISIPVDLVKALTIGKNE